MALQLGNAYGKVTVDSSGVESGVSRGKASLESLAQVGEKVGEAMASAGQKLTLGVTLPILAAGTAAVKYASDLAETKSKVQQIFGDMSEDIIKWADTANTKLGLTRQAALDGASTFALFGKAAKLSGDDLNKFAEQNVQFAADFASFYNTSPEDAIAAIGAAYRGETEPIRKYNILLSDQIIKQKAAELGLMDANGQLSMQNRILAVNKLIMEQSSAAQGDFARTAGGLANQTRIMQAQLHDSLAMLGERLLPIVLKVVTVLNGLLEAFQKLPTPVQDGILVFLGLMAALGPVLIVLGQLITAVSTIGGAWESISLALPGISTAFTTISGVISGSVIPAISGIVAALAPIAAAILVVLPALGLLWLAWTTDFLGFRTTLEQLGFIIQYYWNQGLEGAKAALADAGPKLAQGWQDMTDNLSKKWAEFTKFLDEAWKKVWSIILTFMAGQISSAVNYVLRLRDQILAVFRIDWGQVGRNIILGIVNGILNGIGAIIDAARKAATAAFEAAKHALDARSPSKKFEWLGKMSGLGFMNEFAHTVDPSMMARTMGKAAQPAAMNGMVQNTYNFASGLTMRDVQRMMDERDRQLLGTLSQAFGS